MFFGWEMILVESLKNTPVEPLLKRYPIPYFEQ